MKQEELFPKKLKNPPKHVAIIMDGNGRWALQRGLPRVAGHKAGVDSLVSCVEACNAWGVEVLTVYAFSTENWGRPRDEVTFLMHLLEEVFRRYIDRLHANGVTVKVIGRRAGLPASTTRHIEHAEQLTAENTGLRLLIAFNYGGRAELIDGVKTLCSRVARGELSPEAIDEECLSAHLTTAGLPDPDLLIRTGGEFRISNFLLWQVAYTELYITDVYWPDFRAQQLYQALMEFQKRQRRFGKV
ncbi:MAG: isoprenyl transferase [Limnochordia bacterium]